MCQSDNTIPVPCGGGELGSSQQEEEATRLFLWSKLIRPVFFRGSKHDSSSSSSLSLPSHGLVSLWTIRLICQTIPLLVLNLVQLILAVVILSPGFVRFAYYYWGVADHVTCSYATKSCRQRLDVYPSFSKQKNTSTAPVIFFIPGGGWMIGYKLWGALLARSLKAVAAATAGEDCTIVMTDYRNYPLATVPEQLDDVQTALEWTVQHVHEYGGDASKIVMVGESAGGHLGAMLLLRRAVASSVTTDSSSSSWLPHRFCKGFVSIAAPYDVGSMTETFLKHGLDRTGVDRIFGGRMRDCDPLHLVQKHSNSSSNSLRKNLPPMLICHGTRDKTVPLQGAKAFCEALTQAGARNVVFRSYTGWTHTRGNVEGPMEGDFQFHKDVWSMVEQTTGAPAAPPEVWEKLGRLCPSVLVQLGSLFMPV